LVQLSTERQYSGDSYFREQGFYSNTFTWHVPMDPNACLCYPSQPGVTQTFIQVSLMCVRGATSCQPMREAYLHPRGSSQPPSVQVQFHSSPADTMVIGRRGTLTSGSCLYIRVSGWTPTVWSPMGEEASKALSSGLSLYTLW
jgi:hypothetical protein